MGTPGCTGGGAGRRGALYTGRGPVCGTIMRGAGGGGAAGRDAVEGAAGGGALAEITGGAAANGVWAGVGGIRCADRLAGGVGAEDGTGADAAGGETTLVLSGGGPTT